MDNNEVNSIIKQRNAIVEKIVNLIKEEMEEEGKNLTIEYTIGILDQTKDTLISRSQRLPLKLVQKKN